MREGKGGTEMRGNFIGGDRPVCSASSRLPRCPPCGCHVCADAALSARGFHVCMDVAASFVPTPPAHSPPSHLPPPLPPTTPFHHHSLPPPSLSCNEHVREQLGTPGKQEEPPVSPPKPSGRPAFFSIWFWSTTAPVSLGRRCHPAQLGSGLGDL